MQEKGEEAYKETVGETGVKSLWEGTDVLSQISFILSLNPF